MRKIGKIFFAVLTVLCLCNISYAAVRLVSETEYGVILYGASEDETNSLCNKGACPEAYIGSGTIDCKLHNTSENCRQVNCCKGTKEITVKECPESFIYNVSDTIDVSNMEYCDGYRNGVKGIWSKDNPNLCKTQGITSESYLSKISSSTNCGKSQAAGYGGVSRQSCSKKEGDPETPYCLVYDISYFTACPVDYQTSYFSSCGADGTEAAIPCYVNCGSAYCLGFTCDMKNVKDCKELIAEKKDEGWFSTDLSSTYSSDFPYACKDDGVIKYVGFYCQNYSSDRPTSCSVSNGEMTSCSIPAISGSDKVVYKCSCSKDAQTLKEWCASNHGNDSTCLDKYYGIEATECKLDKDTEGNTLVKYTEFSSDIAVCDEITNWKYSVETSDSGRCKDYSNKYSNQASPVADRCRIIDTNTYATKIVNICKYCENFLTDNADIAQNLCPNGTPTECYYPNGSADSKAYMGCSCGSELKTIEDWCSLEDSSENCLLQAVGVGKECRTTPLRATRAMMMTYSKNAPSNTGDIVYYADIACASEYQTKEDWCAANQDKIESGYNCMKDYVGFGTPCTLDSDGSADDYKYTKFVLACPDKGVVKPTVNECLLEGESSPVYISCYDKSTVETSDPIVSYICKCPDNYGISCENENYGRGGKKCQFDVDALGNSVDKYSDCYLKCGTPYASVSSATNSGCLELYEGYTSTIRGGFDSPEMCIKTDGSFEYICGCPEKFKTIEDWCQENHPDEASCKKEYSGSGTSCTRDVNDNTSPSSVLTKYANYVVFCPQDRPLYQSEDYCTYMGGEYEYSCVDEEKVEKVVCKCSEDSWFDSCSPIEVDGVTIEQEPTGSMCNLDGNNKIKYGECADSCASLLNAKAIDGAYKYLDSSISVPTAITCQNELGKGAVFGGTSKIYCSRNNLKMYPCYCPKSFSECSAEDNQIPAKNAQTCKANGITYYSECAPAQCKDESSTVAIEASSGNYDQDKANIQGRYGVGASMIKCTDDEGVEKWEVSCDTSVYKDRCEYPYEPSANSAWCRYGDGNTLMKDGKEHYKSGSCNVVKTLGECEKSVIENGKQVSSPYTIFTVSSESECASKYGSGASVQLCEYGADKDYKRAYNCYYDASKFKYTTSNCGVRNDLTGDHIIVKGKKFWRECRCAKAYQHHKYNCGGLLSGNPCKQEVTQSMLDSDDTLPASTLGETLPFYPYCECSAEYTEVCDEDGSGRYKGVGTECNGKYKACECIPDALPENWTDNYYGCPGGKKPTGIWKDNGCGQKYYQCSVIECTWEYTEMCESPLVPVGQACQDNQGNIGGYKSCSCPAGYKVCPSNQVGEGEPCNLKGVSYYESCTDKDTCSTIITETCNGPLQIGINPCIRDDITYYERCACANGYTEVCEDGEVGVGNYCELNGVKYYKQCIKPDSQCSEGHVTACDTNQVSYSPCVYTDEEGKQSIKHLCKCPNNWYTSETCESENLSGEKCTQKDSSGNTTTYYSTCSGIETCSPYQEISYKICTEAQTGEGGRCISSDDDSLGVTKYATCIDSNNCYETGFKYSCMGYDPEYLGDACIDANGNRLYKSCPCPSSYVGCAGTNTSKGQKCIPVLEDGSLGNPVYASCECDQSIYKYTCEAEDSGNKGIKPANEQDYCEIFETVTSTGDDGSVTTQEKKVRYYTACECGSEYKYACPNGTGEVVPEDYAKDYCLLGSSKLYKGCGCAADYTYTYSDCEDQGAVIESELNYCTIKGTVPGETRPTNEALYRSCSCGLEYKLECAESKYDQNGVPSCTIEGKTLYSRCVCSSGYKSCGAGQQTSGDSCQSKNVLADGTVVSGATLYSGCSCDSSYSQTCDDDTYAYNSDYCSDNGVTKYKKCICKDIYEINLSSSTSDQTQYCEKLGKKANTSLTEKAFCIEKNGNSSTIRPHKEVCVCDSKTYDTETTSDTTNEYTYCENIGQDVNTDLKDEAFCTDIIDGVSRNYPHRELCLCDTRIYDTNITTQTQDQAAYCNTFEGMVANTNLSEDPFCSAKVNNQWINYPHKEICACNPDIYDTDINTQAKDQASYCSAEGKDPNEDISEDEAFCTDITNGTSNKHPHKDICKEATP